MRKIESLHGIIRPDRDEASPNEIFVATVPHDKPDMSLEIQMFARMNALSEELQGKVMEELSALPAFDRSKLHPDTIKEDCCVAKN